MRKQFYYNGYSSGHFGAYIGGQGSFNAPARDVTKVSIPGRNGDLIQDNGRYLNTTVTYNLVLVNTNVQPEVLSSIKSWLLAPAGSYKRLSDDYETGIYRFARLAGGLDWEMGPWLHTGKTQVIFDCRPQKYLNDGDVDVEITESGTPIQLYNPTLFDAEPVMTIYAPSSGGEIKINGKSVKLTSCNAYTTINSISKECYKGSTNKNGTVELQDYKFPVLVPGENSIDFVSGVTKVVIRPRWWTL